MSAEAGIARRVATLPAFLLLALVVAQWTATRAGGRWVAWGESLWPGYATEWRKPPAEPAPAAEPAATDDALLGELLGEEPSAKPDEALLGELLGDDAPEAAPTPAEPAPAGLPAREAPSSAWLPLFRSVDHALGGFASWSSDHLKHLLILLFGLAGALTTWERAHLSLRTPRSRAEGWLADGSQALAAGLVSASCVLQAQAGGGADAELAWAWSLAFGAVAGVATINLARPLSGTTSRLLEAGLVVPLYASMGLITAFWFLALEGYPQGIAVYLLKLTEHASLYLYVGLYVLAGMLLKRTLVAERSFDLLRPFQLGPEALAVLVVLASAVPTAYSGASGIFVIATGSVLYHELLRAGARPGFALAATAMSGSLGVVLRPCLLVVIVAYLNPPTTDLLYGWGKWVFLLSALIFAVSALARRDGPLWRASLGPALQEATRHLSPLLAYVALTAVVVFAFGLGLESWLDEHSAPVILPVILLVARLWEAARSQAKRPMLTDLGEATGEATGHIGALLLLMGLSIALGGVFERAEVMNLVPADLGSPWLAMSLLTALLVVIGMTMDPYGAVILVSATLAQVAYRNGIDPVHFWMVTLVSFELGYLTPPVALNHLLTRQVIGAEAWEAARADQASQPTWWRRHEDLLLPLSALSLVLLVVAFGPLLVGP